MKARTIAAAAACAAAVTACGTAKAPPAAAPPTSPPATTPAAAITPSATPTPTPSATPSATTTTAGGTLWCGTITAVHIPTLAGWESAPGYSGYGTVSGSMPGTLKLILTIGTPAATEVALAGSLCSEVLFADDQPPPVAGTLYAGAMTDFADASQIMRTGADGYPGGGQAKPDLTAGQARLAAFLTAIGK